MTHRSLPRPARALTAAGLLVLATVGAYLPALRNGFVWDDQNNLVSSARLRSLSSLPDVFRRPAMWSAELPQGAIGTYRPLALSSFILDYQIFGGRAWGFHLSSVLWHVAAQLAVMLLLWRLVGVRAGTALALLGALHPASVEAVAWINGRSEVLALLGGALALACATRKGVLWAALGGLCLLGAMLGKETGVVFVPLVIALACIDLPAGTLRRPAAAVPIAAAAATAAYLLLRLNALEAASVPPMWREALRATPALWVRACQLALIPIERAPVTTGTWLRALGPAELLAYVLAAAALLLVLGYLLWRRRLMPAFGLAWWLMALLPASFVVAGTWPGLHRWLYVGIPGLWLALYSAVGSRLGPRSQATVLVALLIGSVALTERAIPVWRNDATLFGAMIEESPDDPFGYQALAVEMLRVGNPQGAADLLRQAIKLGPTHDAVYTYLAVASARLGQCDAATQLYRSHPDPLVSEPSFQLDLGECLRRAGRTEAARQVLARCAPHLPACEDALARLPP